MSLLLAACSTNPNIQAGGSIQDFSRALKGAQLSFDLSGHIMVPAMSGALMTPQRIPEGMLKALEPAHQHCKRDGGELTFTKLRNAGRANLPARLECRNAQSSLWAVDLTYQQLRTVPGEDAMGRKTLTYLMFTLGSEYLSKQDLSVRIQAEQQQEDARARADTERREQTARSAAIKAADEERRVAEWPARVAAFRASMKSGDRCEWRPSNLPVSGPIVGLVVRTEGAMAYVQFQNLVIGGQAARYVPKGELVPFDRDPPPVRFEIP
jgi:hypothetical protein